MNKLKLTLFFLFFVFKVLAQLHTKDTIYFKTENGFVIPTIKEKAEGYSPPNPYNPNLYLYKISYIQTNNTFVEFEAYDKKYNNGTNTVNTTLQIKNGKYEEWYYSGEKKITCYYLENKLNGDFRVFYPSGNLKRFEKWKNGEWLQGECYDENGNKVEYCSYQEAAEYIGGLSELYKFIGNSIRYPKYCIKNKIEGRVYVSFVVDIDGSLIDIKIWKGIEQHLDDEALRIVNSMPKWKPGRFEGNLIKTKFTLPINFKL